jgi:uncharacterized protein
MRRARAEVGRSSRSAAARRSAAPDRFVSLGEARWGETMDTGHLDRLRRARDLLSVEGCQTAGTILARYSGTGFGEGLKTLAASEPRILLVGLDRLYQP